MYEKSGLLAFHQFDGLGSGAIIRLPLETPTAWKLNDNEFATLGSLWCLIDFRDQIEAQKLSNYFKMTDEIGVQKIHQAKKEILDYFTGNKSQSEMIDVHMRTQTLFSKNELKYRSQKGKAGELQHQKKREMKFNEKLAARIEAEKKMSINDFLNERELKLSNRNSILQSQHFNFLKVLQLGYERIESQD